MDFENLVIAFEGKSGYEAGSLRLEPLIDFLEENFGNVIFRRAYADWAKRKFNTYERQLQDMGVEMIHVSRRTRHSKKNGADILLTADAVESLLLRPFITDFAVVSGDSDIGPLVTKLKAHGKTVIVVGPDKKSTAMHVIELADRFKYYTDIVTPAPSTRRDQSRDRGERKPMTKSPEQAVMKLLREAGEPVESALLKRDLLALPGFSDFNEKAIGFKTWTSFLKSIDRVQVQRRGDLGIEVSVRA